MKFPAVHGDVRRGQGSISSIEDAKGNLLKIERDGNGNILKIVSPHGAYITFVHNRDNHITSATDYMGNAVIYVYDDFERLIAVDDSREGITRYAYDHAGNLIRVTKADNSTWLGVVYDEEGRVAKVNLADGTSHGYSYHVAPDGMISTVDTTRPSGPAEHILLEDGGQPIGQISGK
jgi:YD repeat-containing protein